MIFDTISQLKLYEPLHSGIALVCDFLKTKDLVISPHGRYEIDGDRVFMNLALNDGKGDKARLEVHRRYIDIQCVLYGVDKIGWSPLTEYLKEETKFDIEKDVQLFADKPQYCFTVPTGSFAIFFPTDAHAPLSGDSQVLKAIFKLEI